VQLIRLNQLPLRVAYRCWLADLDRPLCDTHRNLATGGPLCVIQLSAAAGWWGALIGQKRTLAKDRYGYSVAAAGYCGVAKAPLAMAACTLLVTGTEQG